MIRATRRAKGGLPSALLLAVVFALAALGAVAVLLASGRSAEASFPGKNGLLAFDAPVDDGTPQIFTIKPDGSSLKQRTNTTTGGTDPTWSADGTKIAYTGWDGHDVEIYVKDITTRRTTQITDNFNTPPLPTANDFSPTWSFDGREASRHLTRQRERVPLAVDARGVRA